MMVMAGSIGMEVKSKLTSLDIIHSFSCSLMPSMLWMKSWVLWTWWGDLPTRGLRILDSSLALSCVTAPLLEMMGLRGTPSL